MSKKTGIVANVESVVRTLLKEDLIRQEKPYHFFSGCWTIEKGRIKPQEFLTHYRVHYSSEANVNTVNRARQKAESKIRAEKATEAA